jgi:asparagine synthase (glutamine-hydrolysing)
MAWSVEARVPFLDREFMEFAFSFDPTQKMCKDETTGEKRCEKYLLRKAFDVTEEQARRGSVSESKKELSEAEKSKPAYLPKEVLWRQKEQFSDGVGYSWIDEIQRYAASKITDEQVDQAKFRFPDKTPKTKEA